VVVLRLAFVVLLLAVVAPQCLAAPQAAERRVRVAVLDFGETEEGRRAADRVAALLEVAGPTKLVLVDRGLARAAARGAGYSGSLNLTLKEARDLGAAIGCDFYMTGDAQTLRRSSLSAQDYQEAYASVFVVSARTGRLVLWDRPAAEGATTEEAAGRLAPELTRRAGGSYRVAILRAFEDEEGARRVRAAGDFEEGVGVIDLSTDEETRARVDVRDPVPYRRVRPAYPETAERAGAEATVDAAVEVGADGAVARVEIVRWAGFGLDDAVTATVRRMHFRPATRDGVPVPVRVLMRYNFRKPQKGREP
jgi:TonB family protein